MDWGSFFTGVAVTVVGGLILAVVLGGPGWFVKRRERQAKEAEAEAIRRIPISVGGHIVAQELRANADVAKRCEDGSHVPSEGRFVSLIEWQGRRGEMAGLRDEAPALWQKLDETYEALEQTKARGAYPPRSAELLELADRLDKAAERG